MNEGVRPPAIRAIVVDDEPLSRSNVVVLLKRQPDIEVVAECASGIEALAEIRRLRPDLVFLDVEMPESDGFDVLELLGTNVPPAIVFVTAYDRYALQAFDAGALDYLLKPFDDHRFVRALERAKERVAQSRRSTRVADTIAIKGVGGVIFIKAGDIDWIEASDYYSRLHVGAKTHLIRRSMADLESDLQPFAFCRIHRSTIVNLDRAGRLVLNEAGEYDLRLIDGSNHKVSRGYRGKLQSLLNSRSRNP